MTDGFLPYGRQQVDDADIEAVIGTLRAPLITQGPKVEEFERALCGLTGARHAVAFSSGTAALHGASHAAGWLPGDRVVVPPITFCATSNSVLYAGGTPLFCDIESRTWNLDPDRASEMAQESGARGVVAVSFAGLPFEISRLQVAGDVVVVEDACHALGAARDGRAVGGPGGADMTAFSFHPVKTATTGEGGAVLTESDVLAERLLTFRTHGIPPDRDPDSPEGPWYYDMKDLGFNYRITDFQCALGLSQLRHVEEWVRARNEVAALYRSRLEGDTRVELPPEPPMGAIHGRHLFPVRVTAGHEARLGVFRQLRSRGIGVQVHYIPVYRFTHYRDTLGYPQDLCSEAERYYSGAISLPMFPAMDNDDVDRVARELTNALDSYG